MTSASPKPKKRTAFLSKQRSAPSTMSKVGWKGLLQWPSAMSLLRNNREQELSSYSNNLHPSKERIYVLKYKDADDALGDDDASIQVWSSSSRDNAFSIHGQSHLSCRRSWSILYNMLPDRTLALGGEPCPGCKLSKECITVLFCANVGSFEKGYLYIIGNSNCPRCFQKRECHPVTYLPTRQTERRGWHKKLFASWLKRFDAAMVVEIQWIILILDNCSAQNAAKIECTQFEVPGSKHHCQKPASQSGCHC